MFWLDFVFTLFLCFFKRKIRGVSLPRADKLFHHLCFSWSNINGDYQVWLDRELVGSGSGLYKGGMIKNGSTLVIGKDQDVVGRKFDPNRSRIGQVYMSGLNSWGLVLSKSDIITQYRNCYVRTASTIMWSQLHAKEKLRGETFVYPEDVNMCYEQYLIRNKQH